MISKKVLVFGLMFSAVVAAGDLWGGVIGTWYLPSNCCFSPCAPACQRPSPKPRPVPPQDIDSYFQAYFKSTNTPLDQTLPVPVIIDPALNKHFVQNSDNTISPKFPGVYNVSALVNIPTQTFDGSLYPLGVTNAVSVYIAVNGTAVLPSKTSFFILALSYTVGMEPEELFLINGFPLSTNVLIRLKPTDKLSLRYSAFLGENQTETNIKLFDAVLDATKV
jgi:hypothetical protein